MWNGGGTRKGNERCVVVMGVVIGRFGLAYFWIGF